MGLLSIDKTLDKTLENLEQRIRNSFPDVRIEFAKGTFPEHIEFWILIYDSVQFESIRTKCREMAAEMNIDDLYPEVWVLTQVRTDSGPSELTMEELQRRRDDFRRRHNMAPASN